MRRLLAAAALLAALAGCGSLAAGERAAKNQAVDISQPEERDALFPDQTWRIRLNPDGFHLERGKHRESATIESVAFVTNASWTSSSGRKMPSYRFRFHRKDAFHPDSLSEALKRLKKLAEDSSAGIDFCDFTNGGTIPPTTLVLYAYATKSTAIYDYLDISSDFFLMEQIGGHDF